MYDDPEHHTRADVAKLLRDGLTKSRHPALLWRTARALYDVANSKRTSASERVELLQEALGMVEESLQHLAGSHELYAAHKWHGILLSAVGDTLDTKRRIANAYTIRDSFAKAVELNPSDPTSRHLLGRWAYSVAGISWVERKVASLLFGAPPNASYAEALEHFERAEAMEPGFWKKNRLYLGLCHWQLGHKEKAAEWCRRALELPVRTEEDEVVHAEAQGLLEKL